MQSTRRLVRKISSQSLKSLKSFSPRSSTSSAKVDKALAPTPSPCNECRESTICRHQGFFLTRIAKKTIQRDGTERIEDVPVRSEGSWCYPCAEKKLIAAFKETPDSCECAGTQPVKPTRKFKLCGENKFEERDVKRGASGCLRFRGGLPESSKFTSYADLEAFLEVQRQSRKDRLNLLRKTYGLDPKEYEDEVVWNEFYEGMLRFKTNENREEEEICSPKLAKLAKLAFPPGIPGPEQVGTQIHHFVETGNEATSKLETIPELCEEEGHCQCG
ncbi:hypothetical protein BJ508DRAFT_328073 [Ascobolus immersus RN42]|uniref:Uncharacterized protein n=1 Tax=Ascobolus immersus RN42 TaxID=1160509 RepID=A0A3N4I0K8_ASCIM|nr:hypothetical protein BJ508DRAFT_328073 [Ascobolus immersus RN42]